MAAPAIVQANKLNLLGLVNQAAGELSLPSLTTVVGSQSGDGRLWLSLAQREGREFYDAGTRIGGWQQLVSEHAFSTFAVTGLTGTTSAGDPEILGLSDTSQLQVGFVVSGLGFPQNTRILSVDSATRVTCTLNCQETAMGTEFVFSKDFYSLPNDFSFFNQGTYWDRGYRWQLLGPVIGSEWQIIKSGIAPVGPRRRFRIMNNLFYLDPPPTDSNGSLVFEYYTNSFCQSVTGTAQNKWQSDEDFYNFDDDAFVLGLIWRYRAAKGLSFDVEKDVYDVKIQKLISRNAGNRVLPINFQQPELRLLNQTNIPETNYGQ